MKILCYGDSNTWGYIPNVNGYSKNATTQQYSEKDCWWHGLKKDIEEVIQACPECNARNPNRGSAKPLLQPEERTGIPWERVGIDYTDMAKSTEGYSKLLVMIDHATKFVIAKPTKD